MSRPPRSFEPDGIYHVMSRGSNREQLFRSAGDRVAFLERLERVVERYDLRWIAYNLLGNHYHGIVQTPDARLSHAMRDLHGGYSRLCRSVYGRDAHLFRNRFRAEHIDSRKYLLVAMRYCDLNAVRAGLCASPEQWQWSSYRALIGLDPSPSFLSAEIFLPMLDDDLDRARAEYADYVEQKPVGPS